MIKTHIINDDATNAEAELKQWYNNKAIEIVNTMFAISKGGYFAYTIIYKEVIDAKPRRKTTRKGLSPKPDTGNTIDGK